MALIHTTIVDLFNAIANALREKEGSSDIIIADTFPARIQSLTSSGLNTSDATATESDIMLGLTAYAQGKKLTGTFSLDNEINEQTNLITQILNKLEEELN